MATGISKTKWDGIQEVEQQNLSNIVTLSYPGKVSLAQILATPPGKYEAIDKIKDPIGNLFFDENLSVLSQLCRDRSVMGKVRLIYIDPPYATGSVFKSRKQEDAYVDVLTGSNYLEFMRHRLVFLHELLADDGSIYVHLDQNMAFDIKILMDEIFGPNNFRNWITRKKSNPKNYTHKTYGNISDFILFYSKTDNYVWNRAYDSWTLEDAKREYPCIEISTGRRFKKVPVHAPGTRNGATGKPWRGKMPPEGKHWQYTPARLDEMDRRGEIYWSPTGNPRRKIYLDQSKGKPVQDIWLDYKDAHNQNIEITGYPTEKNPDLLRRIVQASSNPGDLVLDCFAGSGTTLVVANELGRRWIGVDNSNLAIETILKRFMYGMEPMGDFVSGEGVDSFSNVANPLNFMVFCEQELVESIREIIFNLANSKPDYSYSINGGKSIAQGNSSKVDTKHDVIQLGLGF